MIAFGDTARDVQVKILILAGIALDELFDDGCPFRIAVGIGEFDSVQAVLQTARLFRLSRSLQLL